MRNACSVEKGRQFFVGALRFPGDYHSVTPCHNVTMRHAFDDVKGLGVPLEPDMRSCQCTDTKAGVSTALGVALSLRWISTGALPCSARRGELNAGDANSWSDHALKGHCIEFGVV